MAELDWKREFDDLGAGGVRAALAAGRWATEKRNAAREWLERIDAQSWQATRASPASADGEGGAKSGFDVLRRYKWVYYIIGGAFGLLGLTQMFKF